MKGFPAKLNACKGDLLNCMRSDKGGKWDSNIYPWFGRANHHAMIKTMI